MSRFVLSAIRLYQQHVSPQLPAACRFSPTCSVYAYEAIGRHGLLRGGWLALRRLLAGAACSGQQPQGWAAPVVGDGVVYAASLQGRLYALDARDGSFRQVQAEGQAEPQPWSFPAAKSTIKVAGLYGTPLLADGLIYLAGYNGKVYAIDQATAAVQWAFPAPENERVGSFVGGVVLHDETMLVASSDGFLYALSAGSGQQRWRYPRSRPLSRGIWATPVVAGDTAYVAALDGSLHAVDISTGEARWPEPFVAKGAIAGTPLVAQGTVYVGSFDRHLYALNAADGALRWSAEAANWYWTQPLLYSDMLYAPSLDRRLYALDADTGEQRWSFLADGPLSSSPLVVDGSLIVASQAGSVYTLDPITGNQRGKFEARAPIYGPVAADRGVLFIATHNGLVHALAADGQPLWSQKVQ